MLSAQNEKFLLLFNSWIITILFAGKLGHFPNFALLKEPSPHDNLPWPATFSGSRTVRILPGSFLFKALVFRWILEGQVLLVQVAMKIRIWETGCRAPQIPGIASRWSSCYRRVKIIINCTFVIHNPYRDTHTHTHTHLKRFWNRYSKRVCSNAVNQTVVVKNLTEEYRSISQDISCLSLTTEVRVWWQANACGVCGGQSVMGQVL
jgi:hypothetical protein